MGEITHRDLEQTMTKAAHEALDSNEFLTKADVEGMVSFDELQEKLPDELWREVADHLSESDGPDSDGDEDLDKMFTPYDHLRTGVDDVTAGEHTESVDNFWGDE